MNGEGRSFHLARYTWLGVLRFTSEAECTTPLTRERNE